MLYKSILINWAIDIMITLFSWILVAIHVSFLTVAAALLSIFLVVGRIRREIDTYHQGKFRNYVKYILGRNKLKKKE